MYILFPVFSLRFHLVGRISKTFICPIHTRNWKGGGGDGETCSVGTQGRQHVMTGLRGANMNKGAPETNNVMVDHLCTQKIVKATLTYGCYNSWRPKLLKSVLSPLISWGKNFYFKTSSFFQV